MRFDSPRFSSVLKCECPNFFQRYRFDSPRFSSVLKFNRLRDKRKLSLIPPAFPAC